ncbi:MAG: hypothetical protein ACK4E3_10375 [Brevundimonas sp.]|jgi:hypothetical protein|uniref:DUF4170 domain-containing protein n=1 Tax=Brevundimonas sp. TaxID=1871086 RepID=UPI00391A6395
MTTERYWVVGGEYECIGFHRLKGLPELSGPYLTRDEARAAWRSLSERTRACATARYSIAAEQVRLPG